MTYRTSVDGLVWSDDAACPNQEWTPEYKGQPFDPQFHFCEKGWNEDGMIVPIGGASSVNEANSADPPEMGTPPLRFALHHARALTYPSFLDRVLQADTDAGGLHQALGRARIDLCPLAAALSGRGLRHAPRQLPGQQIVAHPR